MKNVGKNDSIIRYGLAIVLVIAGVMLGASSTVSIVLYVVAGVMVVTAATRVCPLYIPFGIKTNK